MLGKSPNFSEHHVFPLKVGTYLTQGGQDEENTVCEVLHRLNVMKEQSLLFLAHLAPPVSAQWVNLGFLFHFLWALGALGRRPTPPSPNTAPVVQSPTLSSLPQGPPHHTGFPI